MSATQMTNGQGSSESSVRMVSAPVRPQFRLTTTESFDAAAIPAYRGNHASIYAHIDANIDQHVAQLQRWVRQRSISAQNDGVRQMAELVRDDFKALGFTEAEIVPTSGHPGVWGYFDAGAPRTLMVYMMYDVQPVIAGDWKTPPFAGNLVSHPLGTVLMARGASNQKGPERALLNAISSIIAVTGTLPVNLMITAEGEEELGSPHYPEIVDRYERRLKTAAGVIFPHNAQLPDGTLFVHLGVKGILYLELESLGGPHGGPTTKEIHGSFKTIVDAPAWRLVQALASMTTADGNTIAIPGYYEGIRPPTAEEERLINGVLRSWDGSKLKQLLGVKRWIDGKTGVDLLMEYLYMPTLNINGIWGGYSGVGVKTILPHKATAKVDSRLPMGIEPEQALARIRQHLRTNRFQDIAIRQLSGYPAAQTSVSTSLIQAGIAVFNKYDLPVVVSPRLAGSAPFYQFTHRLGLPLLLAGPGHGSGAHGPNEYMVIKPKSGSKIAGLATLEKGYVDLLYALARE
ncbi:MAG: M20/M25/M40 family metallo-hydrolase [Proteobacteria bacterium]|nr:M20/M25/M40 family metallo-hydrolase [Pseudomonadota bacterium]